jgi:2-isopropylmalate synthase
MDGPEPALPRQRRAQPAPTHTTGGPVSPPPNWATWLAPTWIEGCLFGNGERTGNVCLVTLALNMATPKGLTLNWTFTIWKGSGAPSNTATRSRFTNATRTAATSSSHCLLRSHQDAIKKGFEDMERKAAAAGTGVDELVWGCALPCRSTPGTLGRSYEAVIRVNSQSGKGGMAYLMKKDHKLDLPRRLQIEFSPDRPGTHPTTRVPKSLRKTCGACSLTSTCLLHQSPGLPKWGRASNCAVPAPNPMAAISLNRSALTLIIDGKKQTVEGTGTAPIAAFMDVLQKVGVDAEILDYSEHAMVRW